VGLFQMEMMRKAAATIMNAFFQSILDLASRLALRGRAPLPGRNRSREILLM
jgi:hypothetical protein